MYAEEHQNPTIERDRPDYGEIKNLTRAEIAKKQRVADEYWADLKRGMK